MLLLHANNLECVPDVQSGIKIYSLVISVRLHVKMLLREEGGDETSSQADFTPPNLYTDDFYRTM